MRDELPYLPSAYAWRRIRHWWRRRRNRKDCR